jgi:hypothetical protein
VRDQGPQPDERQPDKIGKEQRRHRRSAVDKLVKEIAAGLNQIRLQVKPESQNANERLHTHDQKADIEEAARNWEHEWDDEKSRCKR